MPPPGMSANELALWNEYQTSHSVESRNALCEFYWPWACAYVNHMACLRTNKHMRAAVLSNVALRLINTAIPAFRMDRGTSCKTYLRYAVLGAARETIRQHMARARAGLKRRKRFMQCRDQLRQQLGRDVNDFEVATACNCDEREVIWCSAPPEYQADWPDNLLHPKQKNETVSATPPSVMPDTMLCDRFNYFTRGLRPKERKLLWQRYFEQRTFVSLAQEYGATPQRLQQIVEGAKDFLRKTRKPEDLKHNLY